MAKAPRPGPGPRRRTRSPSATSPAPPRARPSAAGSTSSSPSAPSARLRPRMAATSTSGARAGRTSPCSTCATASTAPTGWRSIRTRSIRPAPRRSTGTIRATTAPSWPMGSPRTAASRACCTCSTSPAGVTLPDRISRTRAADLAWLPDGSGFYYTRYPAPGAIPAGEEHYHRGVYFHRLGDDPDTDLLVFQPAEKEYWPGVGLSPDGRWLSIHVSRTFDQTDLYLGDRHTRGGDVTAPPLVAVAEGLPASFEGEVAHGRLFLRTNLDAPTYRLYEVDPARPARGHWRELVPARPDAVLEGVRVLADRLALSYLERATSRLRLADLDGGLRHEIALPTLGSLFGLGGEPDGHELFYGFSSYTVPPSVYRLDLRTDAADTLAPGRGRRRSRPVRGAAGDRAVARRHAGDDVPRPPPRARADGRHADLSHRIRRLQHQHDAGVLPLAAALARARRPRGDPQHPGRRRVRRGVAPGRDARTQAEQLRRFRGRRGVAHRGAVHPPRAPGSGRRLQRRTAHGRGPDPAARALRGGAWCRCPCWTCCATTGS